MIALRDWEDMIASRDPYDRRDRAEAADPTENADIAEPIEPIDRTEPTEPIDSTDPLDPIERSESSDHRDHRDPDPDFRFMHASCPAQLDFANTIQGRIFSMISAAARSPERTAPSTAPWLMPAVSVPAQWTLPIGSRSR